MYAIIKLDGNYGYVMSRHTTAESASAKYDKLVGTLPSNALPHLIYRVVSVDPTTKTDDRVRATQSVRILSQ
jgi:hypothetical protein